MATHSLNQTYVWLGNFLCGEVRSALKFREAGETKTKQELSDLLAEQGNFLDTFTSV